MRCGRVTWICVTPIIRRTRCSDIRCKIDARLFRNAADLMLVVRRRQKSTRSRDRGVAGRGDRHILRRSAARWSGIIAAVFGHRACNNLKQPHVSPRSPN